MDERLNYPGAPMEARSRKAEYAEATRHGLLEAARDLFTEKGYADTSIEDVVQKARVTRGALYHHFESKSDLFLAVFEEEQQGLLDRVSKEAMKAKGPWQILSRGTDAFLDACLDPVVHRIVLVDGPSVLGWQTWREIDGKYGLGMTRRALQNAMDAGVIERQTIEPLTHMFMGAMNEAALYIATAKDPKKARREIGRTIKRLLEGLRG